MGVWGLFAALPPTKSAARGFDRLSAVDAGWFPEQSDSSAQTP